MVSPQNLDLTKRTMVHEGPLSWRVNKDKRIGRWGLLRGEEQEEKA